MREKFYIEGHKPKTSLEDENTLIIGQDEGYQTLEEATRKAREYFENKKELGLTVIYREDPFGVKKGIKLIFKNNEGELEESCLQG
jgi:hypothetical protein